MMVIFDHAADFPQLRTELIHRSADRILRVVKPRRRVAEALSIMAPSSAP